WMAGYEPGVLFFFLLGVVAHDSLRNRAVRGWWPALIPCFLAPQIDWQGCFLVPGILVYELLRPRGDRRGWRVVLLMGPVAVLPVLTVLAINVYWARGSVSSALQRLAGPARVAGTSSFTLAEWALKQVQYWIDLMTWPVAILAALGLVLSAFTARRDAIAR